MASDLTTDQTDIDDGSGASPHLPHRGTPQDIRIRNSRTVVRRRGRRQPRQIPHSKTPPGDNITRSHESEAPARTLACPRIPQKSLQIQGRKTVVVIGAGISTSAGFPTFRSDEGRGLRQLFDAAVLRNPSSFRQYIAEVVTFQKKAFQAEPTVAHKLIADLKPTGQLLRVYSQNIDGLEQKAGLACGYDETAVCIQLHGSVHSLKCSHCLSQFSLPNIIGSPCLRCEERASEREGAGKRRCSIGKLLPDLRLYNEHHPEGEAIGRAISDDIEQRPDLLLIMGTSLDVPGVRELVRAIGKAVRKNGGSVVLVNKTAPLAPVWGLVDEWLPLECDIWALDQLGSVSQAKTFHRNEQVT